MHRQQQRRSHQTDKPPISLPESTQAASGNPNQPNHSFASLSVSAMDTAHMDTAPEQPQVPFDAAASALSQQGTQTNTASLAQEASPTHIQRAAMQGLQAPSHPLPYSSRLQQAFGQHDLSRIQIHEGPQAMQSTHGLGARAFTTGEHIVFGETPDLYTTAHETAHVIQQRAGVQLTGGIDTGHDRYEQHADTVAQHIVAGHSVEQLLSSASQSLSQQSSSPVLVQRRNENAPTIPLDATQVSTQKGTFEATVGAVAQNIAVDAGQVTLLFDALKAEAQVFLQELNKEQTPTKKQRTNAPDMNNLYDQIVELAIKQVATVYGAQVNEAEGEAVAKGGGQHGSALAQHTANSTLIERLGPEERWNNLKNNQAVLDEEAILSARYLFLQDKVKPVLGAVVAHHKMTDTSITQAEVEAAYLEELEDSAHQATRNTLAEVRLRWGPKASEGNVYLSAPKGKTSVTTAWTSYKVLVHEIVHLAAHPEFDKYAYAQAAYGNTILEGTVDYFALKVWQRVVDDLEQSATTSADITTVQQVSTAGSPGRVSGQTLNKLKATVGEPLYPNEVDTINKAIINLGGDGEARLKAAFFYGDVTHFFP